MGGVWVQCKTRYHKKGSNGLKRLETLHWAVGSVGSENNRNEITLLFGQSCDQGWWKSNCLVRKSVDELSVPAGWCWGKVPNGGQQDLPWFDPVPRLLSNVRTNHRQRCLWPDLIVVPPKSIADALTNAASTLPKLTRERWTLMSCRPWDELFSKCPQFPSSLTILEVSKEMQMESRTSRILFTLPVLPGKNPFLSGSFLDYARLIKDTLFLKVIS